MTKINISVCLNKNEKKHIKAVKIDNIIKYKDGAVNILDIKNKTLRRKTDEYQIMLDFNNGYGKYKDNNIEIPIDIKILEIKTVKDNFYVKYRQKILEEIQTYTYQVGVEQ